MGRGMNHLVGARAFTLAEGRKRWPLQERVRRSSAKERTASTFSLDDDVSRFSALWNSEGDDTIIGRPAGRRRTENGRMRRRARSATRVTRKRESLSRFPDGQA
ncbi:hypothetical protein KM043_009843 [Ampulex compressa]|nr:hypothetical protein KM043_009843 [Ampulex compressa]